MSDQHASTVPTQDGKLGLPSEWDKGVFALELVQQKLVPRPLPIPKDADGKAEHLIIPSTVPKSVPSGTFHGSQTAMTEMSRRIEQRFETFFDVANFESTIPQDLTLEAKKKLYTFQKPGSDRYSPHLNLIPPEDKTDLLKIFDFMRLLDTGTLLGSIIPEKILDFVHGDPDGKGGSIAELELRNNTLRREKRDIGKEPNVGDRRDWYTDAVFAQQQFTGTNPTTLKLASSKWVKSFQAAADAQGQKKMSQLLSSADATSLYMQDYTYFREAIGVAPDNNMISDDKQNDRTRYGCAAVSLFMLNPDGKLHPLAIVVDYKETIENSVVIFNKHLQPGGSTLDGERTDWPWRYAKTCAQVSDWVRHELTVHLVNTHMVEEVTIVAAHRAFPPDHPVFRLLEPHWLKTLSLNASARSALLPQIIAKLIGMTDDQMYAFTRDAYTRFDWTALYIPNDLAKRGFPLDQLASKKFHNYAYGKNMSVLWRVLRTFVSSVLKADYPTDEKVAKDPHVTAWCNEMRNPDAGQLQSFPEIDTIDELVDAVTMCIHIASPQHTAVNYLQDYYQSFVINKPPSLSAPPPISIDILNKYTEKDLLKALPVNRPREWLLASHVPYLLSYRVAEDQTLLNYAQSVANLASQKKQTNLEAAATKLYSDLVECVSVFKKNSDDMDKGTIPYEVMNPSATAVSILI